MKMLLVVAHGSRRAASNDAARGPAGRLRAATPTKCGVKPAFLELAGPVPGAVEIVAFPYHLDAGIPVASDISEVAHAA